MATTASTGAVDDSGKHCSASSVCSINCTQSMHDQQRQATANAAGTPQPCSCHCPIADRGRALGAVMSGPAGRHSCHRVAVSGADLRLD